jgi:serine/threonine protein phosphatase PrpC
LSVLRGLHWGFMEIEAVGKSHKGLKRKINEDSFLVDRALDLYVVADGMGGHKAGEVASRMVVHTMSDYWRKVRSGNFPPFLSPIKREISDNARHLINSIVLSNLLIHEGQKKPQYHRMGSTVSALLADKDVLWVANVGDSPVYLFDHGRLVQVSEEHSMEAEQKSIGLLGQSQESNPLIKNILTRVLGLTQKVNVFISPIRPKAGDLVLMCTDGLTNYVPQPSLKTILDDFSMSIRRKADVLIEEANRRGGGDNITVILLEVTKEGAWGKFKRKLKSKNAG